MSTVELDRMPHLGPIYRRAALELFRTGRSGDAVPDTTYVLRGLEINRGRLSAYDRVCGFDLTDRLPVTYPHVLAFPLAMRLMSEPGFPLPLAGLVHVANRITVARQFYADESFDLAVHAGNLRAHERGRQVDVIAVATVDGEEVWCGVSTYLRKDRSKPGKGTTTGVEPPASAVWPVPASVGSDYADVSGDRNPIHTSRIGARLFGFARPIAHGMWSMARCLAALDNRLPDSYTVDVAFKVPILLPATVSFSGTADTGFALHDTRSGKPHLTATLTPA